MPGPDKRFDVSVVFTVLDTTSEKKNKAPFFRTEVQYSDLPYVGMVAIEKELVAVLERLTKWGEDIASGQVPAAFLPTAERPASRTAPER